MSPLARIAILPSLEHQAVLLRPGVPLVHQGRVGWIATNDGTPYVVFDDGGEGRRPRATDLLLLARDGAEVYEGTDRLRRVLAAHVGVAIDEGGVVFHGAHGDGMRDWRSTEWLLHPWSSVDAVQFYGDPKQAWPHERYKTIHVPALATPPWPAKPRHGLYTTWALGQVAQAQGLGTLVLLDANGREAAP